MKNLTCIAKGIPRHLYKRLYEMHRGLKHVAFHNKLTHILQSIGRGISIAKGKPRHLYKRLYETHRGLKRVAFHNK